MSKQVFNILIVEDEFINAQFVAQFLTSLSHHVVGIAATAGEALRYINSSSIDFVFMDINIEGDTDGIRLAELLNQKISIPTIYMTAFGDSHTIEEASETNIYGFIIKPFDAQDIQAAFSVAIQRLQSEKEQRNHLKVHHESIIDLGNHYRYDLKRKTLYCREKCVLFTKNESKLIHLFCLHYGEIVPFDHIRACGWGEKSIAESTMRDTILRIRKKIPLLTLENITGIGYCLKKG